MKIESSNDISSCASVTERLARIGLLLAIFPYNGTASAAEAGDDWSNLNTQWYVAQVGTRGYSDIPVPESVQFVSRQDAALVFSAFVSKLLTNMKSAPAEVHREISRRPWDFV